MFEMVTPSRSRVKGTTVIWTLLDKAIPSKRRVKKMYLSRYIYCTVDELKMLIKTTNYIQSNRCYVI